MQKPADYRLPIFVIAILVLIVIASRFVLMDWPNFKPVGALAIFMGCFCFDRRLAIGAVLAIMLISDCLIGFYSLPLMIAVYGSLLIAVLMGRSLHKFIAGDRSIVLRLGSVSIAALAASLVFFLITNTVVTLTSTFYPNSFYGVLQSLAAGLPFFKYTLAGNLLFSFGIFSVHFYLESISGHGSLKTSPVKS